MLKLPQKLLHMFSSFTVQREAFSLKMRAKCPPYCPFLPKKASVTTGALFLSRVPEKLTHSGEPQSHRKEELWTLRFRASEQEKRHL